MGEYHVTGANKLNGEVKINGAKNAILPILASVVLNSGKCIIHDCPIITDTNIAIEILKSIGCTVKIEKNTLEIDSSLAKNYIIPENLVREMRSSFIFLGGVLGRFGKVKISYPGGCELGARPIDIHLKALKELGTNIEEEHGFILCQGEKLLGTRINFDFPSVGATENIMISATLADGETIISNAAKEPEIVDLQNFLNSMGANIYGAGTDTIYIKGVKKLHDTEFTVMPDRIVAGTYLTAAAITHGEIVLKNIIYEDLYPVISKLLEVGCSFEFDKNILYMKSPKILKSIKKLRTHPHPGFPTDMQAQFMALLTISKGTSIITETVFESRNKHIGELNKMGADIVLSQDGMTSIIKGVKKLEGSKVIAKDLRGGAALIIAGLAAEGTTIVLNSNYIQRGYENIDTVLSDLGAKICYRE